MVSNNWSGYDVTKINKVFSGGSSNIFKRALAEACVPEHSFSASKIITIRQPSSIDDIYKSFFNSLTIAIGIADAFNPIL